MELSVFCRGESFHRLMRRKNIPGICRKGWDFQELGHHPLFELLWLSLELPQHLGVSGSMWMCHRKHTLRLKVKRKLNLLSWI